MFWTESAIKAHLDGTFVAVSVVTGRTEVREVALNYMPTHEASWQGDFTILSEKLRVIRAKPWTAADDEQMMAMRERGVKWSSIRKMLRRGEKAVKERYIKICKQRGIDPVLTPSAQAPMLTNEAKAEIIVLRKQGLSPAQVAEMTGRPTYQVVDYYNRFLASKRMREVV